ncbi:hypothetical protein QBC39DRAFT_404056 [Podospora conica]|nr:hypothetical protein QBC39DRAFT_404056 [Schizothecium conicum]
MKAAARAQALRSAQPCRRRPTLPRAAVAVATLSQRPFGTSSPLRSIPDEETSKPSPPAAVDPPAADKTPADTEPSNNTPDATPAPDTDPAKDTTTIFPKPPSTTSPFRSSARRRTIRTADDASTAGPPPVPIPSSFLDRNLAAAVRAEMGAKRPKIVRKAVQRGVTVVAGVNYRGRRLGRAVVEAVATELEADVVHLDAVTVAAGVGRYLNQNMHWNRGSVSMLGYAAAEMNGRCVPRVEMEEGGEGMGMVVALPQRLRSFLSTKTSAAESSYPDSAWEELKLATALEAMVGCADVKRRAAGVGEERRDLIVHLNDYVEISSLHEGIITKLRDIVDTMWQRGRRVVLVGSSSSDVNKSTQWREQLVELGREGSHIIPLQASDELSTSGRESSDNFHENTHNIRTMLEAMLGNSVNVTFDTHEPDNLLLGEHHSLVMTLSQTVYDVQWVYRLVSLMVGGRTPRFEEFSLASLEYALQFMTERNKDWSTLYPSIRPPYYSPLLSARPPFSFSSNGNDDWNQPSPPGAPDWRPNSSSTPGNHAPGSNISQQNLDQHEKKLLSGLINAADIHTTFSDIIVPPETKESLIGLTTLSLTRPDAFSYGVLKTERIPGCLLYGPPGTGKTLLAKAVAKESGASMLEISAASINDMWLGQSEKNVRALFSLARKLAPCVIFLDEADALLGARHHAGPRGGHRETITQFLREWDGLSDMRAFIMVATNRPFDLDEAVLRRLPRKILVDLPLAPERERILGVMLREERLAGDVDVVRLARETELYSGSDLKNLCVAAAMEAVREEVREKERVEGEGGVYAFPEKRVLVGKHFEKGMKEIGASISEDMESLKAIRKFDSQYGDGGRKKKGRKGMGFEVVPADKGGSEGARVRQVGVGA